MSITTCEHDGFIAVYDPQQERKCPACELEDRIGDLEAEIADLEDQLN